MRTRPVLAAGPATTILTPKVGDHISRSREPKCAAQHAHIRPAHHEGSRRPDAAPDGRPPRARSTPRREQPESYSYTLRVAPRPLNTSDTSRPALIPTLLAGLALLLTLAGCGGGSTKPAAPPLPNAADLLSKSAVAMAGIHSATINLQVDPTLADLPIRSAHGTLTSTGDATGTATVNQGGSATEFQFVITQGSLYLKGPTGGYQQLPLAMATSIYDPTALLNPDRGIPALLRTATNGVTEAEEEDINGTHDLPSATPR